MSDVAPLGLNDRGELVTLDRATRNKHLYLIGKSRTGKTTLMLNLMRGDLGAGEGFTFIDPAGDAAFDLVGYVPRSRAGDVIFFDPTREDCPALNLLALPYPPHKLAEDIVAVFRLFFDSWGPRMNMLLINGLLSLLDDRRHEPHTLADLKRLFTRNDYRETIAERADNDELHDFLVHDLPRYERSALDPVLNKLAAFLIPLSPLSRLFSTVTNGVDFASVLNDRKIFVCSLSKGKIGSEPAKFLGGLIVAALTMAALARADQPPASRVDHYLYVDEFQNFAVESFATIFAEAAKYRLNLCVAHQTRDQLTPEIRAALGNASTYVVFRISHGDAASLAPELARRCYVHRLTGEQFDPMATAKADAAMVLAGTVRGTDGKRYYRDAATRDAAGRLSEALSRPEPNPDLYQLTEWPTAHAITNLENLHAFARIERPQNTTAITVPFPPPPDEQARAAVFEHQRQRYEEKQRRGAASSTPPPQPEEPDTDDPVAQIRAILDAAVDFTAQVEPLFSLTPEQVATTFTDEERADMIGDLERFTAQLRAVHPYTGNDTGVQALLDYFATAYLYLTGQDATEQARATATNFAAAFPEMMREEKNRPPKIAQEPRSPAGEGQPTHTTSRKIPTPKEPDDFTF